MSNCASKPFVVRLGRIQSSPAALTAMVYTQAMQGHQSDHLLACLRQSPLVLTAGYGD
jgi:hypothetical protein